MGRVCVLNTLARAEIERRAVEAGFDPVVFALNLRVNQRTLERYFLKEFYCTPKQAMERVRLKCALHLVVARKSTKEIAYAVGYKRTSHFCQRFKKVFQRPLGEVRLLLQAGHPDGSFNCRKSIIIRCWLRSSFSRKTNSTEKASTTDARSAPDAPPWLKF